LTAAGQSLLPGLATPAGLGADDAELPPAKPWPESVRLAAERELLGFHTGGHPLTRYEWMLPLLGLDAPPPAEGPLRCAGLVTALHPALEQAAFRLETLERTLDVTIRGDVWGACRSWLQEDTAVWIEGRAFAGAAGPQIEAARIGRLDEAPEQLVGRVRLRVPPAQEVAEALDRLRATLAGHAGSIPVEMDLLLPSGERVRLDIAREYRVTLTETFVRSVEEVLGTGALSVEVSPRGR